MQQIILLMRILIEYEYKLYDRVGVRGGATHTTSSTPLLLLIEYKHELYEESESEEVQQILLLRNIIKYEYELYEESELEEVQLILLLLRLLLLLLIEYKHELYEESGVGGGATNTTTTKHNQIRIRII